MFNFFIFPKNKDPLKHFTKLKVYQEFTAPVHNLSKLKVLAYISYMYDKNTPLNAIQDILKRKVQAAELAGFKKEKGGVFSKIVENMMRCKNKAVNKMIIRYVRMQRNPKYSYLVTIEEAYYNELQKILEGDDAGSYKKARDMQKDVETIGIELMNEDNNKLLADDLYEFIEMEKLELRPEDIAEKIRNGIPPISIEEIS